MRSQALEDLFVQELEELYDAEKQIYNGLSTMAKAASSSELKAAFKKHQGQTRQQIQRLEKSFAILGEKPRRGKDSGVAGIIRQSKASLSSKSFDDAVADAALIANAQKIEHYEIAAYGCLRSHAAILGYKEIEDLMAESLKEEEQTDVLLTTIAEGSVNKYAAAAPYSQARTGPRHDSHGELFGESFSSSGKLSLGTIALGLAVGGVVSLLFAPKSGAATRSTIADSVRDAADRLKQASETI